MTNTTEDLLFFKLKDLITEQSEGEWTDAMIVKDAHHFANNLRPMLAASPQGEGSSGDLAPIKPSADTGELRERVLAQLDHVWRAGNLARWSCWERDEAADAILDLIQSERGSSPIGQNDQPGLAYSDQLAALGL